MSSLPSEVSKAIARWHGVGWPSAKLSVEPVVDAGLSEARVFRLRMAALHQEHSFALRSWGRPFVRRDRIETVLRFQSRLHKELPSPSIVPEVLHWHRQTPLIEADDTCWSLSPWLAGRQLQSISSVTDNLLQQAISTLAELHAIGAEHESRCEVPAGLSKRCLYVDSWLDGSKRTAFEERLRQRTRQASAGEVERLWRPLHRATSLGLLALERVHASIADRLSDWLQTERLCHWIVGDLWRENILVEQDRITGIVDFGAARIDWPALEVVRWLSSWLGPEDDRLSDWLSEYSRLCIERLSQRRIKIAKVDENLLDAESFHALDRLCCLSAFLQWLEWLSDERFEDDRIERRGLPRIAELAARLDSLHC